MGDDTKYCGACGSSMIAQAPQEEPKQRAYEPHRSDEPHQPVFEARQNYKTYETFERSVVQSQYQSRFQSLPTKRRSVQRIMFNVCYSVMLFFMFFPMIFGPFTFAGYGNNGYGIRQQIAQFADLSKSVESFAAGVLIQSGVIIMIISVILATAFIVTSMIVTSRRKVRGQEINYRLTRIFNLIIFFALTSIFLISFPYLTFTFMCAYTLSFYILLINLEPAYATDLIRRKGNEQNNSIALTMFLLSATIVNCFAPMYTVNEGKARSYNYFDIAASLVKSDKVNVESFAFLTALSMIILILSLLLFGFTFFKYFKGKKPMFYVVIVGLSVNILFSILIGATIRMENELAKTDAAVFVGDKMTLNVGYFVLICLMGLTIITYFIQKAVDYKKAKPIASPKIEQPPTATAE